jgi:transposase-like protein
MKCPKCNQEHVVKNGIIWDKQRFKCKECGFQFTSMLPRGKSQKIKINALILYLSGLSMNAIAHILSVSAQSVMRWIREFAASLPAEEMKPSNDLQEVEFDEFWHYIKKNYTKSGSGKLLTTKLGGLSAITLVVDPKKL